MARPEAVKPRMVEGKDYRFAESKKPPPSGGGFEH